MTFDDIGHGVLAVVPRMPGEIPIEPTPQHLAFVQRTFYVGFAPQKLLRMPHVREYYTIPRLSPLRTERSDG